MSGEYSKGKVNGIATLYWSIRDKYIGEQKNSERKGQGTYNYSNGDQYIGQWKNGEYHGQIIFTFENGKMARKLMNKYETNYYTKSANILN